MRNLLSHPPDMFLHSLLFKDKRPILRFNCDITFLNLQTIGRGCGDVTLKAVSNSIKFTDC